MSNISILILLIEPEWDQTISTPYQLRELTLECIKAS